MSKFDEEVQVFYDRFDKAYENNDLKELAFFNQFTDEKDIRKWTGHIRRQICENARNFQFYLACGLKEVVLNDCGWLEWKIPEYENQEFHPLGCIINRGCCNTKEKQALGILQLPNGKWIAKVDDDFTDIGKPYLFLGIFDKQYDTRTEAWNAALKKFIEQWKSHNKDVMKDDEAVANAKTLIIVDEHYFENISARKGEAIQLSLF